MGEIKIPQHILDDMAKKEARPGIVKWISYKWQWVHELWTAFGDRYFILRSTIKKIEYRQETGFPAIRETEKEEYFSLSKRKFTENLKDVQSVGFFIGAIYVALFRKKNRNAQYEFSLMPLPQLAFIEKVTGKDKVEKSDFR